MSYSDSIKLLLHIQDPNIEIQKLSTEFKRKQEVTIVHACLTYTPPPCPHCHAKAVKNGFTSSDILIPKVANFKTCLRLKKQRFKCSSPDCGRTFLAETALVKRYHQISQPVHLMMLELLMRRRSMTEIAFDLGVSIPTVARRLQNVHFARPTVLPTALSFDEFQFVGGQMAFHLLDAQTHQTVDILPSRRLNDLKNYFYHFSREDRNKVKVIVIDMYTPYIQLIQELFPKALITIDRFHIVQHLNRAFNQTRIKVMKQFRKDSKQYRRLKRLWKLLQMDETRLDYHYHYNRTFRYLTSQRDMVHELVSYDDSLKFYYQLYQEGLRAVTLRKPAAFRQMIQRELKVRKSLNENFKTVFKTFKRFQNFIDNGLTLSYSNGPIEGINNQIKCLKRMAFGYRNFDNFRNRIFLVLVTSKTIQQNKNIILNYNKAA